VILYLVWPIVVDTKKTASYTSQVNTLLIVVVVVVVGLAKQAPQVKLYCKQQYTYILCKKIPFYVPTDGKIKHRSLGSIFIS
jgi:hypothetical protein